MSIKKCDCGYQTTPLELEQKMTALCPKCKMPVVLTFPTETATNQASTPLRNGHKVEFIENSEDAGRRILDLLIRPALR